VVDYNIGGVSMKNAEGILRAPRGLRRRHSSMHREGGRLLLLLLPCLLIVFVFSYLPLWGWAYAFFQYKPGRPLSECEFVGLKNFTYLFSNPVMRQRLFEVLRNTFAIHGIGYLFSPLSAIFAIFLNEMHSSKIRRVVQTVSTLPYFISWVIMYSLAFAMFAVDGGFVNNVLLSLGVIDAPIDFLASKEHVWIVQCLYQLWKNLGWNAIIYLAAIVGIDPELYEAAMVEGAGRMRRIWHITVPHLIPTYFVLLIISIGNFLNTGMEQYLVFSNAMNKPYIEVLDLYVYNMGIGSGLISYATAVGIMKSIVALVLLTFANKLSKKVRGESVF
jgi:putative aldouronate transport system permease protein